jgi:hypothetical protein
MPFISPRGQFWLGIVATGMLLFSMAACGAGAHGIVGKWRTSGDTKAMVWEFSKNGSFLMGEVRGRYRFGDQNRIKIETPFATSVYQMQILGDRMILRDANGSKLEFTRIAEN